VVASRYAGTLGVPAIFPPHARPHLAALRGDRGAKALLPSTCAVVDWPAGALDVDTPSDLASLGDP
jgi:molybdenum cofactor cytidylyltransferase